MKVTTNSWWPLLLAAALITAPNLEAQRPTPVVVPEEGYSLGQSTDFERRLFAPDLIMRHHREIGITAEQRATITQAIQTLQSAVVEPQWRLMESSQTLTELLESGTTNEAQALTAIDEVLAAEGEIKRANISALIRIKNALTQEQRDQLTDLRGPARFWGERATSWR